MATASPEGVSMAWTRQFLEEQLEPLRRGLAAADARIEQLETQLQTQLDSQRVQGRHLQEVALRLASIEAQIQSGMLVRRADLAFSPSSFSPQSPLRTTEAAPPGLSASPAMVRSMTPGPRGSALAEPMDVPISGPITPSRRPVSLHRALSPCGLDAEILRNSVPKLPMSESSDPMNVPLTPGTDCKPSHAAQTPSTAAPGPASRSLNTSPEKFTPVRTSAAPLRLGFAPASPSGVSSMAESPTKPHAGSGRSSAASSREASPGDNDDEGGRRGRWRIDDAWLLTRRAGDDQRAVETLQLDASLAAGLTKRKWERRFCRREHQIRLGKSTEEYRVWRQHFDFHGKKQGDPETPRVTMQNSKREFEAIYREWRLKLHETPQPADPTRHYTAI